MAENKKSFVLYADLIHTVRKMPEDKAGKLFMTILAYINDENPAVDDILVDLVFEPIKQQLKRDLEKWSGERVGKSINGSIGNLKRWSPDLFKLYEKGKITLEDALCQADDRKTSLPDKKVSLPIANVAVNATVNVSDIVIEENTEASPIHALAVFIQNNLPNVSKLKNQLTNDQCEKLVKEYNKTTIKKTLEAMENKTDLAKKYRSVYLTLNNWLGRESSIQTNGSENTSFSGPQKLGNTKITFTPKVNV